MFELIVTDDDSVSPLADSDQVQIHLVNVNDPPNCEIASPSIGVPWPPNHKLINVDVLGLVDSEGGLISIDILGVTQDEPTQGLSNGDSSPDAIIGNSSFLVRSERDPHSNGRVYVASFRAADQTGESCEGTVTVSVPKKRDGLAVDDGQYFDSTQD